MIRSTLVTFLVLAVASSRREDTSVHDYIHWKIADIESWHMYFPSRAFEEERLTNAAAVAAINAMNNGLQDSLHNIVLYQTQELVTAKLMMEGTSSQGCLRGISSYLKNTINQEISNYFDCSTDAIPKLDRVYKNQNITNNKYMTVFVKSLQGIHNCAKNYPNSDSRNRLITCVESWYNLYFKEAKSISYNVYSSPSMIVFVNTVLPCAETAGQNMVYEGWKFLSMLVQCLKLSENSDSNYEKNVIQGYYKYISDNDLRSQVRIAQSIYKVDVDQTEEIMLDYYDIKKNVLEYYDVKPRVQGYYINKSRSYLQNYFSSVSSTGIDNPANFDCVLHATSALNDVLINASEEALVYDQRIVNNTKDIFAEVDYLLFKQKELITSVGNAAILNCFAEGYIFAYKTILQCSTLITKSFNINATEVKKQIEDYVDVLLDYKYSFFSSDSLPGGEKILANAYLGADRVLFNLQRCLYINSGTKYTVTDSPLNFDVPTTSESYN